MPLVGVVIQLTPLPGLGQCSALKTDRVHREVALGELVLEVRPVDQTPLQTVRKHTVDVLAGPDGRPAFEAGVVEQDPIIQVNSVFERTSVKVDYFRHRVAQQVRQHDHRRVRRSEHRDRGVLQRFVGKLLRVEGHLQRNLLQLRVVELLRASPRPPGSHWPTSGPAALSRSATACSARTRPVAVVSTVSTRSRSCSVIHTNGSATRASAQVSSGSVSVSGIGGASENRKALASFRYSGRAPTLVLLDTDRHFAPISPAAKLGIDPGDVLVGHAVIEKFPHGCDARRPGADDCPRVSHALCIEIRRSHALPAGPDEASHAAAFGGSFPSTSGALASIGFAIRKR